MFTSDLDKDMRKSQKKYTSKFITAINDETQPWTVELWMQVCGKLVCIWNVILHLH